MDGRQLYCVVSDNKGYSVTTDIVTLHKATKLSIIEQPKDAYVPNGQTACATVTAAGDGLTYQWYLKNKNGKTPWMDDKSIALSRILAETLCRQIQ